MAEYADQSALGPRALRDGKIVHASEGRTPWISNHKGLLITAGAALVGVVGFLANAAALIEFIQSLFG